eukprot:TRINITY_DN2200_c0_g1_i3.p1 TRINITY_DN2200_c0_g1~~TRINITY_DN2200_c0_g1_i3.p1  ORF type:complete len:973 (-),score=62.73 TRINITY_DN2200_c0_g1_i3:548-3466(-)
MIPDVLGAAGLVLLWGILCDYYQEDHEDLPQQMPQPRRGRRVRRRVFCWGGRVLRGGGKSTFPAPVSRLVPGYWLSSSDVHALLHRYLMPPGEALVTRIPNPAFNAAINPLGCRYSEYERFPQLTRGMKSAPGSPNAVPNWVPTSTWQGSIVNTHVDDGLHWVFCIFREQECFVVDDLEIVEGSPLVAQLREKFQVVRIFQSGFQKDGWSCGLQSTRHACHFFPSRVHELETLDALEQEVLQCRGASRATLAKMLNDLKQERIRQARPPDEPPASHPAGSPAEPPAGSPAEPPGSADVSCEREGEDVTVDDDNRDNDLLVDHKEGLTDCEKGDALEEQGQGDPGAAGADNPATVVSVESLQAFLTKERAKNCQAPLTVKGVKKYAVYSIAYKHAVATLLRQPGVPILDTMRTSLLGKPSVSALGTTADRWREAYPENLKSIPDILPRKAAPKREPGAGRPSFHPEIEQYVLAKVTERRENKLPTTRRKVHDIALSYSPQPEGFKGSTEWVDAWAKRHGFDFVAPRTIKVPIEKAKTQVHSFWNTLRWLSLGESRTLLAHPHGTFDLVINADETPIYKSSAKREKVLSSTTDTQLVTDVDAGRNRFATLLGTVTFNARARTIVPTQQFIVFRGTGARISKEELAVHTKTGVKVAYQQTGWVKDEEWKVWIDKILVPLCKNKRVLIIFDAATTHTKQANLQYLQRKTGAKYAVIPGGLTSSLQYLDVFGFAGFKTSFHRHLDEMKDTATIASRGSDLRQDVRFSDRWYREAMSTSVGAVWGASVENVGHEEVATRLKGLGYVLNLSGSEDGCVTAPCFPELRFRPVPLKLHKQMRGLDLARQCGYLPVLSKIFADAAADLNAQEKAVASQKRSQVGVQRTLSSWVNPSGRIRVNSLSQPSTQTLPTPASETTPTPPTLLNPDPQPTSTTTPAAVPGNPSLLSQGPKRKRHLCTLCKKPGHNIKRCRNAPADLKK